MKAFLPMQAGVSMLELLLGMLISSVLLVAMGQLLLTAQQSYDAVQAQTRLQDDGRIALYILGRVVGMAGQYDWGDSEFTASDSRLTRVPLTAVDFTAKKLMASAPDRARHTVQVELTPDRWVDIKYVKQNTDVLALRYEGLAHGETRDCRNQIVAAGLSSVDIFYVYISAVQDQRIALTLRCTSFKLRNNQIIAKSSENLIDHVLDLQFVFGESQTADSEAVHSYRTWPKVLHAERVRAVQISLKIHGARALRDLHSDQKDTPYSIESYVQTFQQTIALTAQLK